MAGAGDMCVSVQGVSKKFSRSLKRSLLYGACDIGRALVGTYTTAELRASEFWAVKDVSFDLRRGECIGVIGLNGSGKTTLLRMVAGIVRPTLGKVNVTGTLAPMLALGAGFKPVLSGRENVFLNLSLLGIAKRDIRARFDSIVDFAELWDAIDAPIGTYSSGMLARLGFACAVHTNPDVLIVDEVLSVGDAPFRVKCRNRINELRRAGTAMLLVSHSAVTIQALTNECVYLRYGQMVAHGPSEEVLRAYEADTRYSLLADNVGSRTEPPQGTSETNGRTTAIREVQLKAIAGTDAGVWLSGKPAEIVISISASRELADVSVNILIADLTRQSGETVQFMMSCRDIGWLRLTPGHPELRLSFPTVGLRPGVYRVKVSVSQGEMHDLLAVVDDLKLIVRDVGLAQNCLYFQQREWNVVGGRVTRTADPRYAAECETVEEL